MFGDLLHFAHTCAFYHYYLIGVSLVSIIINIILFFLDTKNIENFFYAILRTTGCIVGALVVYYLFFILIGLFITLFYILGILFIIALLILFAL